MRPEARERASCRRSLSGPGRPRRAVAEPPQAGTRVKMALPAIAAAAGSPLRVADENSRHASLILAFAQPGDTLLYLLLPLHHDTFVVTLAEAGLLLAANRLVRIAGYGWVARFYAERGPRAACL